jgi:hypothetical protein
MLALSDSQLRAIWAAAGGLPIEKSAAPTSPPPILMTRCGRAASRIDVKSSRGLVVVVQIVKGAVF